MKHAYRNLWKEAAGSGRKVKRCKTKMTGEGCGNGARGVEGKGGCYLTILGSEIDGPVWSGDTGH